jgi:hypothetical protein
MFLNDNQLIISVIKGNNRIDNLTNTIETRTIGLLFMITGIDKTLRINESVIMETSEKRTNLLKKEVEISIFLYKTTRYNLFLYYIKVFTRLKTWYNLIYKLKSFSDDEVHELEATERTELKYEMIPRYQKDI